MSLALLSLLSVVVSLLPLTALALNDPKRLRSLRQPARSGGLPRSLLAAVTLLPGLLLAISGHWPVFLIWLGATAAGGWLLVQALAYGARSAAADAP